MWGVSAGPPSPAKQCIVTPCNAHWQLKITYVRPIFYLFISVILARKFLFIVDLIHTMGFGESAKKWIAEALFFVTWTTHHFCNFQWIDFRQTSHKTRIQVVFRDTWFQIPERFPLRGWIFRKTVFLRNFREPCLCSATGHGNCSLRLLHCFHPIVDIPQLYLS